MRYTQITDVQTQSMLAAIGAESIEDLFSTIPNALRLTRPLNIPRGSGEMDVLADLSTLARANHGCSELVCFLGGGAYDHFVPTLVDALASRSEFVTSYTPYQAEASQGMLQLLYEFQTMISMLTGMDAANSSLYESASAAAEAVMMAGSITGRHETIVAESVHPDTLQTLRTYARERGGAIVTVPAPNGIVTQESLSAAVTGATAAIVIQSPNFYGCVENLDRLLLIARAKGALGIVSFDPIAGGVLKTPGELGADIVIGEGQALGIPLQYGGPYLGFLATREKYLRKMPGRVVGMTTDKNGRRGFCLILQTREQHIRRERATSNVCTNQGLLAVRASIAMAAMGRSGLKNTAEQCFDKAHYTAAQIAKIPGFEIRFSAPFFKEFVVRTTKGVSNVLGHCKERGILGGVGMARFDERMSDCFLVAVTERRTRREIDDFIAALAGA